VWLTAENLSQSSYDSSIASFQHGLLESRPTWTSPDDRANWMPANHAGTTELSIFMFCSDRKIMNHFVVSTSSQETQNSHS
jgi:hypothetical protein